MWFGHKRVDLAMDYCLMYINVNSGFVSQGGSLV